jgi:hypothetical protein
MRGQRLLEEWTVRHLLPSYPRGGTLTGRQTTRQRIGRHPSKVCSSTIKILEKRFTHSPSISTSFLACEGKMELLDIKYLLEAEEEWRKIREGKIEIAGWRTRDGASIPYTAESRTNHKNCSILSMCSTHPCRARPVSEFIKKNLVKFYLMK